MRQTRLLTNLYNGHVYLWNTNDQVWPRSLCSLHLLDSLRMDWGCSCTCQCFCRLLS